jgi:putative ABC transport system substrate-binding protein
LSEYPAIAAEYIARIFKGARPGDLPIVLPSRWELVVSKRAATSMGVAIPPSLRLGADEVLD